MGKKAPKMKAATTTSPYSGIGTYNTGLGGISSAYSRRNGDQLNSITALSPELQSSLDNATAGLRASTGYMSQDPAQRMANIDNNTFYQALRASQQKDADALRGQVESDTTDRGMGNSTLMGGYLGQMAHDQLLRDLQDKISSMDYLDQKNQQDQAGHQQVISTLANLEALPLQTSNQNLQTGFGSIDQASALNAQLRQQAAQANLQSQIQANAQRSQMLGNIIGTVGSLAAIPLTGGLSALGAFGGLKSAATAAMTSGQGGIPLSPNFLRYVGKMK